jgi:hypothetical protein
MVTILQTYASTSNEESTSSEGVQMRACVMHRSEIGGLRAAESKTLPNGLILIDCSGQSEVLVSSPPHRVSIYSVTP